MSKEKTIDVKINPAGNSSLNGPSEPVLFKWKVRERKLSGKKMILAVILASLVIVYFVFAKNYFGAIVIFLCYVVFYLQYGRENKELNFAIKGGGIQAVDKTLEFDKIKSFRIIYRAEGQKELKIESKKKLMPEISLPIGNANPVRIREILLKFLPEKE